MDRSVCEGGLGEEVGLGGGGGVGVGGGAS